MVTAVLCVMMLSGFVSSLLVANTSDMVELTKPVDNVELSELSEVWYHDCTNLTGFTNITDSSWFYPYTSNTIVDGDIGLGTSWIQANDVGSGSGWHGPVNAIPLSTPFEISKLERFDARIGFDSSVGSQLGGIRVMLHDSNQKVICQFNIFDSWADDKQLKMPAHWAFLNGSSTCTPWSEPDWVTFAPYDETLSIIQNSTGFFAIIPEIGNFRLNVGPNDDLDRIVSYVSVWFAGNDGYSFCDSIHLHSIRLEWTAQVENFSSTWHHDCSNMSYFNQYMNWPMDWWWEPYTVSDGVMSSDGEKFTFSGLTQASGDWYGPIYAHNFPEPFQLNNLKEFKVDLVIDNTNPSVSGIISVYLCDADFSPAVQLFCSDSWNWRSYGHNRAHYRFSNGSYTSHGNVDYMTWTAFNGTLRVWTEENGDLYADVPGFGQAVLVESENIESDREIYYLVIQAGRLANYAWMPSAVNDIYVKWLSIPPFIDHPRDVAFETGMTGNNVTWTLSGEVGDPYIFYLDEGFFDSGTYNGQNISINTDSYSVGVHNLTVWCNTSYGIVQDTVWVTVHPSMPPTIDNPPDVTYVVGETGNTIEWHPDDISPASFILYIDGAIEDSGDWDGSSILYNVDGYDVGVIEYVLYVFDLLGNNNSDSVLVYILAELDMLTIDHPPDIQYDVGDTGYDITWTPSSYYPAMYQLFVNDDLVDSGLWFGNQIVISVDGLSPGIYNYILCVFNTNEESVSDDVIVTVLGQTVDDTFILMSVIIGEIAVIIVLSGIVCQRKSG